MIDYLKAITKDTLPNASIKEIDGIGTLNASPNPTIEIKLHKLKFYLVDKDDHVFLVYEAGNIYPTQSSHKYQIPYNTPTDLEYIIPYYLKILEDQIINLKPRMKEQKEITSFLRTHPSTKVTLKQIFKPNQLTTKFLAHSQPHSITYTKSKTIIKRLDSTIIEFNLNTKTSKIIEFITKI